MTCRTRFLLRTVSAALAIFVGCAQPPGEPVPERQDAAQKQSATTEARRDIPGRTEYRAAELPMTVTAHKSLMGNAATVVGDIRVPSEPLNRENYADCDDNPVQRVAENPVSTFSIDVDTGAYANVRRLLHARHLPPQDEVRAEELINHSSYDYLPPSDRTTPFSVVREIAPTPWNADN